MSTLMLDAGMLFISSVILKVRLAGAIALPPRDSPEQVILEKFSFFGTAPDAEDTKC